MTWPNILERCGREKFISKFSRADLVGFVNWTMLPYMGDIWESILKEVCPTLKSRRLIFFDLADPEKRTHQDIKRALGLVAEFQKHFDVVLGLNEKEAYEIGEIFGLKPKAAIPECLAEFTKEIAARVPVSSIVVHPVSYALTVSNGEVAVVEGPFAAKPLITTGAGDHFNSGFCLGRLLGLDNAQCVLCGVTTSGYYVRTAQSPTIPQLAEMMNDPAKWLAEKK